MIKATSGRVGKLLALCVAAFGLAGILVVVVRHVFDHPYVYGLVPLFDLDEEGNFPTTFSMLLLVLASGLSVLVAVQPKSIASRTRAGWFVLAFLTLLVAIDEVAAIHEHIGAGLRLNLGLERINAFHFAWTVPAAVLLVILAPLLLRLAASLGRRARNLAIAAGIIYVSGAFGTELIDGWYAAMFGEGDLAYDLLTAAEEILEMTGAALFDYAMLVHLGDLRATLEFEFH